MRWVRIVVGTAVVGGLLAACSSEPTGTPPSATSVTVSPTPSEATPTKTPSTSDTPSAASGALVGTAKIQGLGTVLVSGNGHTLYLFTNDTGSTSTCTGSCAATWPAYTTKGAPVAKAGADDGKLGTTGGGGKQQVTYEGHPLYIYSGDSAAGDANGQGIGGVWFAVTTDGEPAGSHG